MTEESWTAVKMEEQWRGKTVDYEGFEGYNAGSR